VNADARIECGSCWIDELGAGLRLITLAAVEEFEGVREEKCPLMR
jgi:hypothetical protein